MAAFEEIEISMEVAETPESEEHALHLHSDFRRARRNRSSVWNWFSKVNRNESTCNTCGKTYKTKAGGTSSLLRHMTNQHSGIFEAENEISAVVANTNENGM